jgi:hypothetical protein
MYPYVVFPQKSNRSASCKKKHVPSCWRSQYLSRNPSSYSYLNWFMLDVDGFLPYLSKLEVVYFIIDYHVDKLLYKIVEALSHSNDSRFQLFFNTTIQPTHVLSHVTPSYPSFWDQIITLTCRGLVFHPTIYIDLLLVYHHLYSHCLMFSWPVVDSCLPILYHLVCTFSHVTCRPTMCGPFIPDSLFLVLCSTIWVCLRIGCPKCDGLVSPHFPINMATLGVSWYPQCQTQHPNHVKLLTVS